MNIKNDQLEVYDIAKVPSILSLTVKEVYKDKFALAGVIILFLVLATVIIAAPIISTEEATRLNFGTGTTNRAPSWVEGGAEGFLLGTDQGGRDMFQLVIVAARNSLIIGFAVAIITMAIGFIIGLLSGFYGGHVDNVVMRLVETWTMLPALLVIATLINHLPRTLPNMIFVLVLFGWAGYVRLIRNVTLQQANYDYVLASKTMGTRNPIIIFREVVPNLMPVLAPAVVLGMAGTIGVETGLSMLGFGLPIGTPSLGTIINNAMVFINLQNRWWTWLPGIAILFFVSISINFVGTAIQRVADPRQRVR